LPLDVLSDLSAYESLLIELAKRRHIQVFKKRRAPKIFSVAHLAFIGVEEGSAVAALALETADETKPGSAPTAKFDLYQCFDHARDLIAECSALPGGELPAEFPVELVRHFNRFGRSLKDGESLELSRKCQVAPAVLTQAQRQLIVQSGKVEFEIEVSLTGTICEADWAENTFRLRLDVDGSQVTIPAPKELQPLIGRHGGKVRDKLFVKGLASFDSAGNLKRFISTHSAEISINHDIAVRFDEISQLDDGWLDGHGLSLDSDPLALIASRFIDGYPGDLPIPFIYPTPESNLLLEWDAEGDPATDIDLKSMTARFHASSVNCGEAAEMVFDLRGDTGFEAFFDYLSRNIKGRSS
jgi:hypothetical protein